MIKFALII